jgi:hypothetical protein
MKPGHKVIAKLLFPDATDGAEQPDYNPADGMFYVAISELKKDEKKGGVAVIDATGKLQCARMHSPLTLAALMMVTGRRQAVWSPCNCNGRANARPSRR